jgi:Phosphotransferase enzyme family
VIAWSALFPPGAPVMALPSWRRPRLLLSARSPAERWTGSAFYPAFRLSARCYRPFVRLRAAAGFGERRVALGRSWALGEFVGDVLPGAASCAVLVGSPGPAQKLTAQVRDAAGRVIGYVKWVERDVARERVRNEYCLLTRLPAGLGPRPMKYESTADWDALLLAPLAGARLAARLPPPASLDDFLAALPAAPAVPIDAHPALQGLAEQCPELTACVDVLSARSWPVVVQHGDFAPWNLLRTNGGALVAVDWEYGRADGFPFIDLLRYVLSVAALIYSWRPDRARRYARAQLLRRPGLALSEQEAAALVRLAAYDLYRTDAEDGYSAGAPLQAWRRAIWATPD